MSHYRHHVRDLEFTLFELLNRGSLLGSGPYSDMDRETANDLLSEVARLATDQLANSWADSDRHPPVFDPANHTVQLPDSFKQSYQAYVNAEFWRTELPDKLGGTPTPPSLRWAIAELVVGANPALVFYASSFPFARILYSLGNDEQKKLAEHMVDQRWGATMVLTEPDAGSDVGAGRASATPNDDGTWTITGVKRFITSGESDLTNNIVHFVLARPQGGAAGTKGLSLFVIPKYRIDLATGELGERNGVFATNVEDKMGLKASTTCELRFSEVDGIPAIGTLLGDVHDGIAQMFHVIEYARMLVGTKAIATLSSGYINALEYATTRVQGADLSQMSDKTAPRVTTIHHPDVRRSLMLQKAYAEGLRALMLFTASQQDAVELAQARGETDDMAERLNDLLLPLVKGCGSERSWVLLGTETLQTYGGSGYLRDYPLEQYVRDAKIDTLYEGTTAIQGLDFFFRKIVRDRGTALAHLAGQIEAFAGATSEDDPLTRERALLANALADVQAMVTHLVGVAMSSDSRTGGNPTAVYPVGLNSTRLLLATGDLVIGWLLLRSAEVAQAAMASDSVSDADKAFYTGKVAAARFFAQTVLPRLSSERSIVENTDAAIMELPENSF